MMHVSEVQMATQRVRFLPPEPITVKYLIDKYGLDPNTWTDDDTVNVEIELTVPRVDGQELLSSYRQQLDRALAHRCATGQYDYSPVANVETPHTPHDAAYATSFAIKGWVISCGVSASELPELGELDKQLREIKLACDAIIWKAIEGHRK